MAAESLDTQLTRLKIDRTKKKPKKGGAGPYIFLLILLAGGAAGGYTYYARANAPIVVKVIQPSRETVKVSGSAVLTAGGYVIPRDRIEVSSKIIGRVKEIYVERGDHVKAGDVILRIDDEEYQAQVKVAEARVGMLKARLAELRAGSRPQEIASAQANVASAEATVSKTKSDLDRLEPLAKEKVISAQELDLARQSYAVANATLQAAKKNTELVEVGPRKEIIAATESQLREAEANLELSKIQLAYTVIEAPSSGTILEKVAKKGELVTNTNFGGTRGAKSSVVAMADLSDLQVELDITEADLPKIHVGQKTEIKLDSNPSVVFQGIVDEISPQADRQKATVQVKVRLLDPKDFVRPDLNARVTFVEDAPEKPEEADAQPRIWISPSAVVQSEKGPIVYLVSQGQAVARAIKTGSQGPQGLQITDGLVGTESIIVEPLDKMKDGAKVTTQAS